MCTEAEEAMCTDPILTLTVTVTHLEESPRAKEADKHTEPSAIQCLSPPIVSQVAVRSVMQVLVGDVHHSHLVRAA